MATSAVGSSTSKITATTTTTSPGSLSRRSLEDRAKRIVEFYLRVNKDKRRVVEHFEEEGVCKRTIAKIIRRHEEKGDVSFTKPPGRKGTICTDEMFNRVATLFRENPNLPSGEAAKQLGIARTTIFRVLAKMREKNIETFKIVETRCPTCHQKCDPKVLMKKLGRPKNRMKKENNNNNSNTQKQTPTNLKEKNGSDKSVIGGEELGQLMQ